MTTESGPNWLLRLAYAGGAYAGWQIQPDRPTVQGQVNATLAKLYGTRVETWGCSRTDRGVHALAQQVTFRAPARPPVVAADLERALRRMLPGDIRVLDLAEKPPPFHARYDNIGKAYTYVFHVGEVANPFLRPFCTPLRWELDLQRMQAAAALLTGRHDFSVFGVNTRTADPVDPVKTIDRFQWFVRGRLLGFSVVGDSFLYRMVRRLAGYFVDVGRRRLEPACPEELPALTERGGFATAPPQGLYLHAVFFDAAAMTAWRCCRLPFLELLDLPEDIDDVPS